MKILSRFSILALLLLISNFAGAQVRQTISGHVYRLGTVMPVANQVVTAVWLDTMNVPANQQIYYSTTTTATGEYSFGFSFPQRNTPAPILLSTVDCQNYPTNYTVALFRSPITQNFYICHNDTVTPPPCNLYAAIYEDSLSNGSTSNVRQFYSSISGNYSMVHWDFGDGGMSSDLNPSHTYSTQGTFSVSLTVTQNPTCIYTANYRVRVDTNGGSPCNLNALFSSQPLGIVAGSRTYQFTNLTRSNTALSYFWVFGDSTTSLEENPVHTYLSDGSYQVSLTVTDVNGCYNTFSNTVNVNPRPCNVFASFTSTVSGSTVSFRNTSRVTGTAMGYRWTFGDGSMSDAMNPTHTYARSGNYVVYLTVAGDSCQSTTFDSVAVRGNVLPRYNISGRVTAGGRAIRAFVVLFGLNRNYRETRLTLDSNNVYHFENVPMGEYIVRAYPSDTTWRGRPMPTFFGGTMDWTNATHIRVDSTLSPNAVFPIDLLLTHDSSQVNNYVRGRVSRRDSINANGRVDNYNINFHLQDVVVTMMNLQGQVVGGAMPNANGSYQMPLPTVGSYFIAAQYPKVNTVPSQVIVSNTSSDMTMDFISNSGSITAIANNAISSALKIAPVPAISSINISAPFDITSVQVTTITGVNVSVAFNQVDSQNAKVSLETLAPGVYMVQVTTSAGTGVSRFVKQ